MNYIGTTTSTVAHQSMISSDDLTWLLAYSGCSHILGTNRLRTRLAI